ncbi:hypothetical protein ACIOGZ_12150 [Kitasatospora sp. NPDC088160]|uniref:hypothetical protein n=1 Tax=Kitasatospora sp. NPDC088160 TaxID=3364072 RepID=UPI00380DFC96
MEEERQERMDEERRKRIIGCTKMPNLSVCSPRKKGVFGYAPLDDMAEVGRVIDPYAQASVRIVKAILGVDTAEECIKQKSVSACAETAIGFFPGGKFAQIAKKSKSIVEIAQDARRFRRVEDNVADGRRLQAKLAAEELAGANGHAFDKHVITQGEFPGIRTREQFAEMIEEVILNGERRIGAGGRGAYWRNGVIVICNPNARDGGTVFAPKEGYGYFLKNFKSE